MRAKKIYEHNAFQRGKDPLDSMGIGRKVQIENWFKKWAPDVDYKIDDNFYITIFGSLNLKNTKITKLPDNLTVYGWLNLYDTKITELPNNLNVFGFLNLYNTKISKLPNNLYVFGYLDITGTKITELPDDLELEGNIYGIN